MVDSLFLTRGPVLVIGAGLLGTSIALRLRRGNVPVYMEDASPIAAELARDLGGGSLEITEAPQLVVVAVPPDVTAQVVKSALDRFPNAVITDVSSVKSLISADLLDYPGAERWVGAHPMAGKERSGAIAADADLFRGRPWVVIPNAISTTQAQRVVHNLGIDMGGAVVTMNPQEHDHAVAVISHMPQIMSSLVAGALTAENANTLNLAGQGLRDVTRIAQSDPLLWTSIIAGNRQEINRVLTTISARLNGLISAINSGGELNIISNVIAQGNNGVSLIPGKHGGAPARYREVIVLIPDEPGSLGRLFSEIGEIGINIEDLTMEHSVEQEVGRVILSVIPAQADALEKGLLKRGWQVVSITQKQQALIVAIDGPSGSGKSTVAREIAIKHGLAYLDTGAMYRTATWWALENNVDLDDAQAVIASTKAMPLDIPLDPQNQVFVCAGIDISEKIRASCVSKVVSQLAANMTVREYLISWQQELITKETQAGNFSAGKGIVAEGRDITTVVAPHAQVRVLLTASEQARLARRSLQLHGSIDTEKLAATADEVLRRDRDDSRVTKFMKAENGVTTIDSSALTVKETVEAIENLFSEEYYG